MSEDPSAAAVELVVAVAVAVAVVGMDLLNVALTDLGLKFRGTMGVVMLV